MLFYRLRGCLEQYGLDGVHPKRRQARRGRPSPLGVQTERRVIAFALAWPTCGPQWFSDQLAREGLTVKATTIWRLLRRARLGTRRARLAVLEQHSAATIGLLTERTGRAPRHVARCGLVVRLGATDRGGSHRGGDLGFLRDVVRPSYRQAGWRLGRVLTDNGKEFTGVRSIKEECLDRLIPLGACHVRRAVVAYVEHYHRERNHQGLYNRLIAGSPVIDRQGRVRRHSRLGGLLTFCERAARGLG